MSRIVWIGISFFCFIGCKQNSKQQLAYYEDASFTPLFLSEKEADLSIHHRIDTFIFIDQTGNRFSSAQLEDKIHVANFFFTGCGSICPGMMDKLSSVQKQFNNKEVLFLSFSVTPWSDSVKRLRAYADLHQIDDQQWKLLTGTTSRIYQVARRSYFAEEALGFNKDSSNFLHTEHVLLIDKKKRIRGIYNGTLLLDMQQLSKDIETLESSY
jgi:protein SCO1/2